MYLRQYQPSRPGNSTVRTEQEPTDPQWERIAPWLPEPRASPKGGPKPIPNRTIFKGVLWMLRRGAQWKDLPDHYPSACTCRRRLRQWKKQGAWLKAWQAYLAALDEQGRLEWYRSLADIDLAGRKKRLPTSAKRDAISTRTLWWWQTAGECLAASGFLGDLFGRTTASVPRSPAESPGSRAPTAQTGDA